MIRWRRSVRADERPAGRVLRPVGRGGRGRRAAALALAALASAGVLVDLDPAGAATDGAPPRAPAIAPGASAAPAAESGRPVDRVLLVSLPGVTWTDVAEHDLPVLEEFFTGAALADHAPRGVSPRSTPGAAYLTISAGSRAISDPLVDGQQLGVEESTARSTAGEVFERRTGVRPHGAYVALTWPGLLRRNAEQPYDAVPGLLADTLADAGLGLVPIGNADGSDTVGVSYERQVGLAAASRDGVIAAGELTDDLLVDDPSRPFGLRLDQDAVVERFTASWASPAGREGGAVIVEASDLARTMRYRGRVDAARYDELWAEALAEADELVGRLLAEVGPNDAVVVLAPYNLPGDRDLTVAAMAAPGRPAGYLRSASTQRSGFVTLVDVGPTVLQLLGVARPLGMEGRAFEAVASGDSLDERVDRLVSLNAASRFRERLLFPTTLFAVIVLAFVCAAATVVVVRGSSARTRRIVGTAALANIAVLPLSYVARGFPLEEWGAGFYWAFLVTTAIVTAVAVTAVAARLGRPLVALVLVLALVCLVLAFDVMTGSRLSLSAAFGYSPTGNSRLYGISNYSFGQLAAASCLLAAFLAALRPRRPALAAAVGLLVAVLVVTGVPVWGSDVGGVLAFAPVVLLFAVLVTRGRVQVRHVVAAGMVTIASLIAFGLLDLARPPRQRAHLGRLFERVADEGIGPLLSIMERKALAVVRVSTTSFWVAAIPIAIAFLIFLSRYPGRPMAQLRARIPTLGAGIAAAIAAAVLGSIMNDSGAIIAGVALLVVAASLAFLVVQPAPVRRPPPEPAPPPSTSPQVRAPEERAVTG